MTNSFLLPHKFKKLGWILLCLGLILGFVLRFMNVDSDYFGKTSVFAFLSEPFFDLKPIYFNFIKNGILDEVTVFLIVIGGVLVGFCKTKVEDEFISNLRNSSLVWSVYVNYAIILLTTLFIYGSPFMDILILNIFTVLLFFIVRFHLLLYRSKNL